MDSSKKARPIKSDVTLLKIIDVLTDYDTATVSDIADEVEKSKSTVYFHLATLEKQGFITKKVDGYALGLRFLDLGVIVQDNQSIFPAAKPKIKNIANQTGEKAWCFVEEQGKAIYLFGQEGEHSARTHSRVGQRNYIHAVAAGKAILAHLSEDRRDKIIEHHGLPKLTNNTITARTELETELEEIRQKGISFNLEESIEGMRAVSAPVKKEGGGVHGALSISGPAKRLPMEKLENELGQLISGAANELEINLRYD